MAKKAAKTKNKPKVTIKTLHADERKLAIRFAGSKRWAAIEVARIDRRLVVGRLILLAFKKRLRKSKKKRKMCLNGHAEQLQRSVWKASDTAERHFRQLLLELG